MPKRIPKCKNENEEREFWATHDTIEYVDWRKAEKAVFSNLKPSVKKISLRLPESMLEELKLLRQEDPGGKVIPSYTLISPLPCC